MLSEFASKQALRIQNDVNLILKSEIRPTSWLSHVPFVKDLIGHVKPEVVVELGTYYGVSLMAIKEAIIQGNLNSKLYGIDNFEGDMHVGKLGDDIYLQVSQDLKSIGGQSELIKGDFDTSLSFFADSSIDLLHIDGTHTYESVRNDFNNWNSKMSDKSIILFHDIHVRRSEFGVFKLWEELTKDSNNFFQFNFGYGLGVLLIGDHSLLWTGRMRDCYFNQEDWSVIEASYNERSSFMQDDLIRSYVSISKEIKDLVAQIDILENSLDYISKSKFFRFISFLQNKRLVLDRFFSK